MGTEPAQVDVDAWLAYCEAQRAFWDGAIAMVKQMKAHAVDTSSLTFPLTASSTIAPPTSRGEVRPDSFLGLTVIDAIKKYLRMAGSKQSTEQIAKALLDGGVETTSDHFPRMVGTILYRLHKEGGEVIKVKKAWGLAEWYGPHIRRQSNGRETEKPKRRKISRKSKASKASNPNAPPIS